MTEDNGKKTMRLYRYVIALIFFLLPVSTIFAAGGSLFLSPESGSYGIGESFEVSLFADTDGLPVNAAEARIIFDQNLLEVLDISTRDSVLSLWPTTPNFSNAAGVIEFSGWAGTPFTGARNHLLTVTFRVTGTGSPTLRITSGALLAADGSASNIVTALGSSAYNTQPRQAVVSASSFQTVEQEEVPIVVQESTPIVQEEVFPEKPVIIEYSEMLATEDRLVVKGTALPDAKVVVWFARNDDREVQESVTSSSDGSFTFISKAGLKNGNYRLWAEVYNNRGVLGPPSETLSFEVRSTGAQLLSATALAAGSIPSPTTLTIIIVGFLLGYALYRFLVVKNLI